MTNDIKIRAVNENDYTFIHDLLVDTWYQEEEKSEALNKALAEMALNHYLNRSTFGLVAEINGDKTGFILAKVDSEEPKLRLLQSDPYEALLPILNASESERGESTLYLKRELELNAEMLEESETSFDAEICLFIVSPKGRGKGIGNQLFQEAIDEFKRLDVEHYYLYTDDESDYSFYEKRQMQRSHTRPFNPAETLEESSYNMYLYENDE